MKRWPIDAKVKRISRPPVSEFSPFFPGGGKKINVGKKEMDDRCKRDSGTPKYRVKMIRRHRHSNACDSLVTHPERFPA
jgi:hypothetical protein